MGCPHCDPKDDRCHWDKGKWCGCGCHYNNRDGNDHWSRMQAHVESLNEFLSRRKALLIMIKKFGLHHKFECAKNELSKYYGSWGCTCGLDKIHSLIKKEIANG